MGGRQETKLCRQKTETFCPTWFFLGKTLWVLSISRTYSVILQLRVLFRSLIEPSLPSKQSGRNFLQKNIYRNSKKNSRSRVFCRNSLKMKICAFHHLKTLLQEHIQPGAPDKCCLWSNISHFWPFTSNKKVSDVWFMLFCFPEVFTFPGNFFQHPFTLEIIPYIGVGALFSGRPDDTWW